MKDWVYYSLVLLGFVLLFAKPLIIIVVNELLTFASSVLKYFDRFDLLNLFKIIFGVGLCLWIGYLSCKTLADGKNNLNTNEFPGLKYFANLTFYLAVVPPILLLILFQIVSLIGGGYSGLVNKINQNQFPEPGGCLATIIDSPPFKTRIEIKIAPRLELAGQPWSRARVEQSLSKNGPWVFSTNSAIPPSGVVSLDLKPGIDNLFFKVSEVVPPGITGFVWINPGSFLMGSPETEVGRNNLSKWEEIQHQVTVSRGFWISDHEVTQSEYGAVTGDYTRQTDFDSPVVGVSWYDAVNYCSKLTDRERGAGRISYQQIYRLPTEAEWEYVCRAGTSGARYGVLNDIAWSRVSASMPPYKVRLKLPNSWGVYDTLGNVWEWCSDWSSDYPSYAVNDPVGPSAGNLKIVRGGVWNFDLGNLRAAGRFRMTPDTKMPYLGFRPVLSSIW
jgi:hypothetical protein